MSAYEELVERCRSAYDNALWGVFEEEPHARNKQTAATKAMLAEVLRTLEVATEEMNDEANGVWKYGSIEVWLAMLRASPLSPPGAKP